MTDQRHPPPMWTDTELDAALDALRSDAPVDPAAAAAARTRLLTAAAATGPAAAATAVAAPAAPVQPKRLPHPGGPRRSPGRRGATVLSGSGSAGRRWRPLAAVAVVAVLVAVGLVAPTWFTRGSRPVVSADAARTLTQAAAAIGASDEPVGAGQYRYLETRAWWAVFDRYDVYLAENRITVWVPPDPADPAQLWMLDRAPTGNTTWLSGDRAAYEAAGGFDNNRYPTMRLTAACGTFYSDEGCARLGSWQDPTPQFLAELPRDPTQLYQRLRADAPDNSRGDAEILGYAADLLRSGLAPADLRVALYQALSQLPGLEITDNAANLDGRIGTALGMDDGTRRQDIIIDPATGAFIGERQVLTDDVDGVPAGATINFTALTTEIVDTLGARPGE